MIDRIQPLDYQFVIVSPRDRIRMPEEKQRKNIEDDQPDTPVSRLRKALPAPRSPSRNRLSDPMFAGTSSDSPKIADIRRASTLSTPVDTIMEEEVFVGDDDRRHSLNFERKVSKPQALHRSQTQMQLKTAGGGRRKFSRRLSLGIQKFAEQAGVISTSSTVCLENSLECCPSVS